MIHEYFIDPNLIYKWALSPRDAKFFLDRIGVGNARLLSSFPKSKASKLRGQLLKDIPLEMPEVARLRVDQFASELTCGTIARKVAEGLPAVWSDAAKQQCATIPPDVVIASNGCNDLVCWITEDDVFKSDSLFDHRCQLTPDRSLSSLTNAVKNLLRYSRRIVIVDPYSFKQSGIETVKAFVRASQENRLNDDGITLQVLFDESRATVEHVRSQISSTLSGLNIEFNVLAVKEKPGGEKFHNRYLLTELGGISFGVGTDAGEAYHSDDLFLLDRATYEKRWDQYWNAAAFDVV